VKSSEDEAAIRSKILLKEKRIFTLTAFEYSRGRIKEQLESKGMSLKEFKYEQLTDTPVDPDSAQRAFGNPVYVDILVLIDSEVR
jgi:hypothetical protein